MEWTWCRRACKAFGEKGTALSVALSAPLPACLLDTCPISALFVAASILMGYARPGTLTSPALVLASIAYAGLTGHSLCLSTTTLAVIAYMLLTSLPIKTRATIATLSTSVVSLLVGVEAAKYVSTIGLVGENKVAETIITLLAVLTALPLYYTVAFTAITGKWRLTMAVILTYIALYAIPLPQPYRLTILVSFPYIASTIARKLVE